VLGPWLIDDLEIALNDSRPVEQEGSERVGDADGGGLLARDGLA
jgi:hypothetical protein